MLIKSLPSFLDNIARVALVTSSEVMHTLQVGAHVVLFVGDESCAETACQFSILRPAGVTPNQVWVTKKESKSGLYSETLLCSTGTHSLVLVHFLLCLINSYGAEFTGIAGGHVVLPLQMCSHIILFVSHMGETHFANVFPIQGSLGIFRNHVWVKK